MLVKQNKPDHIRPGSLNLIVPGQCRDSNELRFGDYGIRSKAPCCRGIDPDALAVS